MSRTVRRWSIAAFGGRVRLPIALGIPLLFAPMQGASAQSAADSAATVEAPSLSAPDSTWLVQDSASRACLDRLSDGSLRPVTVYQIATASDTSRDAVDQVALISQHIGEHLRAALGSGRDSVSTVDTLVPWRHLAGRVPVRIVVHRDTATTWSIDSGADPAKAKLAAVYASVLRTMPDDELELIWPEHLAPDSLTVLLQLTSTESSQKPLPRLGYPMIAVFRTHGVGFVPAMARLDNPAPAYPTDAVQRGISAEVIEGIVVRPNGSADGSVGSVVLSSRDPIGNAARKHFAGEFRSVVERVMKHMRFEPAHIGGCPVPQQADYPFTFRRG